MPKNIVVFSDGTGQEGGKTPSTNVHKLFGIIEDRTADQVSFYDRGIGTGLRKVTGGAGGKGISKNIQEGYEFIFENFEAGDRIFLFGFSRGAATVRSLSSFIHHFGILPKSRPELIERAYAIYKLGDTPERDAAARDFVRLHRTLWTRIRFLGCWDTVAALGLPFASASAILDGIPGFRHRFHNFDLSPSVEHAVHALAIDDERKSFLPVLWNAQVDPSYQTLKQVWFAGVHTDVGGGYQEPQLSDLALVWMTQHAVERGLRIYREARIDIDEDPDGFLHDSRGKGFRKLFRKQVRFWDPQRTDKPVVHASVLERKKDKKNQPGAYAPWILDLDPDVEPWVPYSEQPWKPA